MSEHTGHDHCLKAHGWALSKWCAPCRLDWWFFASQRKAVGVGVGRARREYAAGIAEPEPAAPGWSVEQLEPSES